MGRSSTRSHTRINAPPSRISIERVTPSVGGGRYPIKRTLGEPVTVEADIYADGHDALSCWLLYRMPACDWRRVRMEASGNDRWHGTFTVTEIGRYEYTVLAVVDHLGTWQRDLRKRIDAGQELELELQVGASMLAQAAKSGSPEHRDRLSLVAADLVGPAPMEDRLAQALDANLSELVERAEDGRVDPNGSPTYPLVVDPQRARFSSWYELFPRSATSQPGTHGTFRDCEDRLSYIAGMGFDVLYLPPIHPIGHTHRKGKGGAALASLNDPGSPWAIGSEEGGHTAVHSQLGSIQDFRRLTHHARELGIEVALDLAFQCSPDHPWVKEHPEWFRIRPDGSVQYAENPPKKYEDIYPLDFESRKWRELWEACKDVVTYWIEQGVRIFRVDNPHTKPFAFWEWLIAEIKATNPDVIFLSEAFTRPRVMYRLAQVGFTQSYTYFTWRNTRGELTDYLNELNHSEVRDYFRPNLWPNTPDILSEYLQSGGRPAFVTRLTLAATLGANYGIYGPAFELCEVEPRTTGAEEYASSEKYEIRHWDLEQRDSLRDLIAKVNGIRQTNPALQQDWDILFHETDNDQLLCYSKKTADPENVMLMVVGLDPHFAQAGWVQLDLDWLGLDAETPFQVHDLLTDARYLWQGSRNYVELDPHVLPAHIFRVRRRVRSERDFDYYL
ncbi:MAG TPA: alpha-1,4-glucan--maltose-1-phosphate maltosyltransferase [Chloroflexota bacterium]